MGYFDFPTLIKLMFGGFVQQGYLDVGFQGQIFYTDCTRDNLKRIFKLLNANLTPIQKEQTRSYLRRWRMGAIDLLHSMASNTPPFEDVEDYHRMVRRIAYEGCLVRDKKDILINSLRKSSFIFHSGLQERSWEKITTSFLIAYRGCVEAGLRCSWQRINLSLAYLSASKFLGDEAFNDDVSKDFADSALKHLLFSSPRFGFKTDWLIATIYGYPSIYSELEVLRDDWPNTIEGWRTVDGGETFRRSFLCQGCASPTYLLAVSRMTSYKASRVEGFICRFCLAFWNRVTKRLTPRDVDVSVNRKMRGKTDCQLDLDLTVKR